MSKVSVGNALAQDGVPLEMNGNIVDQDDNPENSNERTVRIIKKAKRHIKQRATTNGNDVVTVNVENKRLPFSKNSRKSRNGRGRGLPKKGGAGGKGVWGTPGQELFADSSVRDAHDPNYDSDNQGAYIVEKIKPELTQEEFEKIVGPLFLEYFQHGISQDVIEDLEDLKLGKWKPKLLEYMISIALDHKATHREMTSVLISDLYGKMLNHSDMGKGFDEVLTRLSDLTIDTPDAPTVVGQFIARAVADDCLPPKYIHKFKGNVDCKHQQEALDKADVLLSQKHGIVRLDNIWGTGGGIRPVKYLIKQIVMLLKEYLSSGDIAEATRCLRELEVPHFHHEVVFEATVIVLEDSSERSAEMMCELLKSLADAAIITSEQMVQGFRRVYDNMPDLCLDVPNAYVLLERFANICHREGILSAALLKELPQRGRKRFVSEGDGGRVKQVDP
ncbi:LOW QUALITY PROTEIN: programmed cell death protein 4-like [Gigantopelta aegis]|uniref:LOW QUALITY PROTEIN: programmed cell death protein 4-like n=1 Tax=Gigantopelta aegis TaxID=1735272 RepID=UPI001B88A4A1|nr:LOW QUALITY PROTEIN: programmed cell death protein 4-like [Gigantopelta aegis]